MEAAAQQRPTLRKDAERNRRRLLEAAREVFEEQGIEAPLEEIARRADVGIATLYRRFPTRSSLIEALFEDKAREYARVSKLALEHDDAWEGLAGFIRRICEMQAEDRGFCGVLQATFPSAPELQVYMGQARRNTEKLAARARREGKVRADFAATDVFWILVANGSYLEATRDIAPRGWRRYLALILDSIRVQDAAKLPPPPTGKQVGRAVERIGRRAAGE